jgi:hypothetical protein
MIPRPYHFTYEHCIYDLYNVNFTLSNTTFQLIQLFPKLKYFTIPPPYPDLFPESLRLSTTVVSKR